MCPLSFDKEVNGVRIAEHVLGRTLDEVNGHPLVFGQVGDLVVGGVHRVVLQVGHGAERTTFSSPSPGWS